MILLNEMLGADNELDDAIYYYLDLISPEEDDEDEMYDE